MITTTIATLQGSKGDSSELYILLDANCSDSTLSYNYLNLCFSIKKAKSMYYVTSGPYKADKHGIIKF